MTLRISGLASGMDTESIISDMMKVARLPLDKLTKKQQTLEWKRDDYRSMNTLLLNFRNEVSNMKYTNKYRVRSVSTSDESKLTATANNTSSVGSTTISNVKQLAKAEVITGGEIVKNGSKEKIDASANLLEQLGNSADSLTFTLKTPGKEQTFTVKNDMTMKDVVSMVNNTDIGVNMFYDSVTGKVSLSRSEAGMLDNSGNVIVQMVGEIQVGEQTTEGITNYQNQITGSGEFLSLIGFSTSGGSDYVLTADPIQQAENVIVTINGIETQRSSNSFTENGVTYTIKQTFTDSVTATVINDTDAIYDNIKGFVDKYNELISSIQSKINEERNTDYEPLTDAEKEELSETQIEKWENIAKTGLLRNDSTLSSVLLKMRLDFSGASVDSGVSAVYKTLSSIGITTTSNYLEGGKLEIDEDKLKAAIEADPNAVEELFRGENGIAQKLYDTVNNSMEQIKSKAGNANSTNQTFTIGRELDSVDDRIESLQDRLEQIEERYWKQFTAMETAIQKANDQYSTLSSYFSTGS